MSSHDTGRSRRELLINGRRVRIFDLIEAGLLKPGDDLYFQQRIGEEPYRAQVTDRGRLELADGREFKTPSAAGRDVAGLRAVAGWSAWRVGPAGPTLHELRLRLLRSVAEEVTADTRVPEDEAEATRRRFARLEEARSQAEKGEPPSMTVRELIRMWGIDDRDRAVTAQITADLANHGLVSVPDFRAVSLDRTVRLETTPQSDDDPATADEDIVEVQKEDAEVDEESGDIGLTLGNLLSDDSPLFSVKPSATFEEAITVMQINDFSQVAVLASPYTVHGAVSWKSIAEARHRNAEATFSDAIDLHARDRVFDYDRRLLDVLDTLQKHEFIFVRDEKRQISGIITAADVVRKYDDSATPFFLIGEVDQELRQLLQNTFDEDTVRQACTAAGLPFKSINSMSIGQYQAVLANPDCWAQLGWPVDRQVFIDRLDELRKIRNNVMHFNHDPVKPGEVEKLRVFLRLIRRYTR
jgi:predicted transcriptional regulator